jgi:hypothetical protein
MVLFHIFSKSLAGLFIVVLCLMKLYFSLPRIIIHPSLLRLIGASCRIFLDDDCRSRWREYAAGFDSFTPLLDRLREMRHPATITMIARRPQPPATPPAIGPARELLITGVNAGGAEAVTEDCETG